MLRLENIHKLFDYNGNVIQVLKGIHLLINPGESLSIMGASGVGKSTLLHIMGALEPPTQGIVRFDDKNVNELNDLALCKLRNRFIGFVFQFHHLLLELNALENTLMPLFIARHRKKDAMDRAIEMLEKVGLGKRLYHRVGELSGGEQQRVAIARALIMKPKLLLADEPTGNLDKNTGERIIEFLVRLNEEEGLAMVIATHNHRLASEMSRQMEMVDGRFK
ncbi:MAG: ABC transporter ATP-binding protein [Pseudomonadota bacterium]